MANMPGETAFIPDEAVTLFGSKKYGREAFRILEREATAKGPHSRDAKRLHWQMKQYLKPSAD
jgi:hypothetical protein